ncbi:hypothetical protein [Halomarina rubra]|uniref:PGF-CTERM sorting domain-containing protein n=1 Tax=Halomarina rubra TaxID=2071873 RepID=A0ABD6AWG1_9EURY|nr:hypothetical protein [Halomarina rubra]
MTEPNARLSRRRLLATAGTSVAALAAGPTVLAAQDGESERVAVPAVMPQTGAISGDEDYTGFLLKLTSELDTTVEGVGGCTVEGWTPSNPRVFETQVVDTVNAGENDQYEVVPSSAYLPQDTDFASGDLFVINNQSACGGGEFLGIQLENVRDSEDAVRYNFSREDVSSDGGGDDGESGALGPGFGPVAALGGVLGGAYALARRGRGDD